MSDAALRHHLIRLAHAHPEMRPALLPLLRSAREFPNEEARKKYLEDHPNADPANHTVAKPDDKGDEGGGKAAPKKPKKLFSDDEMSLPSVARQSVSDPAKLMEQATEAHEQQLNWLNHGKGLDKAVGGKVIRCDEIDCTKAGAVDYDQEGPIIVIGPVKKKHRVEEKVEKDYDGDWSRVGDLVRSTVALDSMDQVEEVMDKLRASGLKLARPPKDRFANPTDAGYRDLMMNVVYPNGHIGELQIHLKPILKAKEEAHGAYEEVSAIGAKAKKEGRTDLTDEEAAKVDEAMQKMRDIYEAAWKKSTAAKGGKTAAGGLKRMAAKVQYFDLDGMPALWEAKKFPVRLSPKGKEVVIYELDEFFDQATPISKDAYDKLVKENAPKEKKQKEGSLRLATIRLAQTNSQLRPHLLALLK